MKYTSLKPSPPFYTFALLFVVWYIGSICYNNPALFPTPMNVLTTLGGLFLKLSFWHSLFTTFGYIVVGMVTASILALALLLLSNNRKKVQAAIAPLLSLLRTIPIISFILLLLVWVDAPYIPFVLALITATPILYENMMAGITSLSSQQKEVCTVYKLSKYHRITHYYYPHLLPYLVSGGVLATNFGIKAIIIGEVLSQQQWGIGCELRRAQSYLDISLLIAWTIVAWGVSFTIEHSIRAIRNCYFPLHFAKKTASVSTITSAPSVSLQGISKSYETHRVYENYTHLFEAGVIHHIEGRSGSGKTTLLRMIAQLERFDSGHIELSYEGCISYLFQENRLFDHLTVLQNITLPLAASHTKSDAERRALLLMEQLHISPLCNKKTTSLSGGEARRVALARALLYPSSLWLMDEPLTALDKSLQVETMACIEQQAKRQNATVLLVEHLK